MDVRRSDREGDDRTNTALLVWRIAIETDYAIPDDWIPWADKWITALESPPLWMVKLAVARSRDEAWSAVFTALHTLPPLPYEKVDYLRTYMGFLYLSYERGQRTREDLFAAIKNDVEGSSVEVPHEFVEIGRELPAGRRSGEQSIDSLLASGFLPWKERALRLWDAI